MSDVTTLATLAQGGAGALVMAILFVVALLRGWVVPGYVYTEALRTIVTLQAKNDAMSERIILAAERMASVLKDRQGGGAA